MYKLLRHLAKIKQLHITYLYYTNLYMRNFYKILKNSYPCFFLKFLYPNMSLNNFSNGTALFWLYIFKMYAFCLFIYLISVCECVFVCAHMCVCAFVYYKRGCGGERTTKRILFLLPSCGPSGLNTGCQAW